MVVLTYSAGFVILEKENPMVMLASSAGSLVLKRVKPVVMVASSGISFVLETGFGEKEADGCAALLGCSPFSASFSLVSYALPYVPHCFLFLAFPSPSVFFFPLSLLFLLCSALFLLSVSPRSPPLFSRFLYVRALPYSSSFSFLLCSAGAALMENGSGCWTKKMMS